MSSRAQPDAAWIGPCPPAWRKQAWSLLLADLADELRPQQIASIEAEGHRPGFENRVWAAGDQDQVYAAVAAQRQPGRVVHLWAPALAGQAPETLADGVLTGLLAELDTSPTEPTSFLAQAVCQLEDGLSAARLQRGGFRHLADLDYRLATQAVFPAHEPALPFDLAPQPAWTDLQWAGLIAQTYDDTLDCPQLNPYREPGDVVAGYRQQSASDRGLWLAVQFGGEPAGCLILGDHPRNDFLELVYMGLIPRVRGRGWGCHLVRHAQWRAGQLGRRSLLLAVDAANTPAGQMYDACGLVPWERRRVYWRPPSSARFG